jgi:hypothetical protein
MASVARFIRTFGFGIFSVGLHLTLVVLCVLFATPTTNSMAAEELIEVEMQPALGQPHGKDKGKDLGSHVPKPPPPKMPEPEPFEAPPPLPPPDPEAIPTTISSAQLPDAGAPSDPDAGDAGPIGEAGTSDDGGEYDPTTPVGSENVPPGFGSPDGVPGGQGTSTKKISAQYRSILAGWARARFPTLGGAPEGKRPCAMVTISISPGRQVTGASMSPSGNATWDQHVQGALGKFQGATVPADPEGGPAPPSIGFNFCWD